MGEYNNNRRRSYCPNFSHQYGWTYVTPTSVMPTQYMPEMAGNQPSIPPTQPAVASNANSTILHQGQHQYFANPGVVQNPVLMPTIVGFQPQGYYYNPQSPHLGPPYVNYGASFGNEEYNGAQRVSTFQDGYRMPVMQSSYNPYSLGTQSESVPHQFVVPSTNQQQKKQAENTVENKFHYEDDSFPPEFVPRYKYTTPPVDNASKANYSENNKKNSSLQIQMIPSESDLLPAGLLSPSLDSRSKSTISDLEDYAGEHDKTQHMNPTDTASCMSSKSVKPPSPLPGYKIFEPNIKYKMFGPKEKPSDSNSELAADKTTDLSPEQQIKMKNENCRNDSPEGKPPSLMQVAVEPPMCSVKTDLNAASPAAEVQYKGAKPKTNRRPPKMVHQDSISEEPQIQSDRGYRSGWGLSRRGRQGVHSEDRGRDIGQYTSSHARQGVHSEGRVRELTQSSIRHAQEKSAGRQKLLAQTAAYFNPPMENKKKTTSSTIVEGQGVRSRTPRQGSQRQAPQGSKQKISNRARKLASNPEDSGVSQVTQSLNASLTFYNTSNSKERTYSSRRQRKDNFSHSSDVSGGNMEKQRIVSASGQQVSTSSTSGRTSYARKASGPKYKLNQREQLEEQLKKETYECMVCMEKVLTEQPIWSCSMCYHIFHQHCIQKWYEYCLSTTEEAAEKSWRCPSCQHVDFERPGEYYCFCGKLKYPPWNPFITPHTCGDSCGRRHVRDTMCNHPCVLPCHPGPCPTCQASMLRKCPCGKSKSFIMCGSPHQFVCEDECGKLLDCGRHRCTGKCHYGSCNSCQQHFSQECFCKKNQRTMACTATNLPTDSFPCDNLCGKSLSCGQHECKEKCHTGDCEPCDLLPEKWSKCPCGRVPLSELSEPRTSCVDPIPSCGKICNKELDCVKGGKHKCQEVCHVGDCICRLKSFVHCLCGQTAREVPCGERDMGFRCTKKCNKKRTCHRHKCLSLCCTADFHPCPIECKRFLSCGTHKCDRLCHVGNCPPCSIYSFEELHCRCGTTVIYPPVACGTKPPECDQQCNRDHDCNHIPMHTCHSNDECPPCCTFTEKWCYGKHEVRKNVPCHQNEISCGKPCGAMMPCNRHSCTQVCHKGECVKENEKCQQKCDKPRTLCGHPCNAECHEGDCPDTPCMQMVQVLCQCKNIVMTRTCCTNTQEYKRMTTSVLAQTMVDLQQGHTVNITEKLMSTKLTGDCIQILECSAECKIKERNRRMAMALQIKNPDMGQKLMPRYSENMRRWAKRDTKFVQGIHDQLTELVTLAKQSKQKSRSHSFPVMNRDKRQFVHEYCEHFGCESTSYDEEPKRNVVATASKDGAWLPSMGIIEVIDRENGVRKVPVPPSQASSKKPVATAKVSESKPNTNTGDETYIQVTAKSSAVGNRSYIQVAGKPPAVKRKEN